MLTQKLQQKLLQKLSPQQIQLMKLLQVPTIALEQRIKQEIEDNPALEDASSDFEDEEQALRSEDTGEDDDFGEAESESDPMDEFNVEDYLQDDETPSYRLSTNNRSPDEEDTQLPFAATYSFHDNLLAQIGLRRLDEKQVLIAEQIIGNIDDSGYMQRDLRAMADDMAFSMNMEVDEDEIAEVLDTIQQFDPPGIGARNLRECLLIQLRRQDDEDPVIALAIRIITRYFNEFTKKHYSKIIKKAGISEDELKEALDEILKLNPKPGNSMSTSSGSNHYIIPDFILSLDEGEPILELNARNAPELKVSRTYQEMLRTYSESKSTSRAAQKEALMFVKQKIDSAKWFIDAIKQRHNTLRTTMEAIIVYQKDYFTTGDETKLRPMILKDIADIVHLDISTISRVANSKYIQTPFGTFLLKTFFSESMSTDSGEEVSTREIKKILQNNIEKEEKRNPLTDEELAGLLKDEGYQIARRTVAKYREQLNIPVARLRKEL